MAASSSSSFLQIMWEALQLPAKAGAIFIPLLLLTLLSSSLLFFSAYSISPLLLDLVSKIASFFKNPIPPTALPTVFLDIEKDLHDVARLASLIAPLFFFASLFLTVATTFTFLTAYAGETLSPKQVLLRVARRWYQSLVTRLYVVLLSLGLALLSALAIGAVMLVSGGGGGGEVGSEIATSSSMYLAAAAGLLYLYLSTRWAMSLVVTVAEETWGIGALSMSVVLFIGNKRRGTLLTLALKAVEAAIYGGFVMALAAAGPQQPPEAQMRLWLAVAVASAVWEVYAVAVYTVFYHECRKSHGLEDVKTVQESGDAYARLPAAAVIVTCSAV